jgi:hypothetical protein
LHRQVCIVPVVWKLRFTRDVSAEFGFALSNPFLR